MPKSVTRIDGDKEKDGNHVRSAKANKEEHISLSEWQLTIESKKNREELMWHLILRFVKMCYRSLYQLPSFARHSKKNQEAETPGHSVSIKTLFIFMINDRRRQGNYILKIMPCYASSEGKNGLIKAVWGGFFLEKMVAVDVLWFGDNDSDQ
ncbi:hypothetical protein Fot_21925 [Forsythia ovata]|uniref:Uncharacterized protein n=1 Tax=Forsythia ovata TaxID=205694 RepID=A0ABD1UWB9_9LAMI